MLERILLIVFSIFGVLFLCMFSADHTDNPYLLVLGVVFLDIVWYIIGKM